MPSLEANLQKKVVGSEQHLPPIPNGRLRELVRDPLSYFTSITRQYGDVVCYRPAPETAFLINHPDYIRHVLVDNQRNYSKDTYSNRAFKKAIGEGLINYEGTAWLRQRRLMQPAFHHNRLEPLAGMIVQATGEMLDRWQAQFSHKPVVDMAREMAALTMTITSRALFGVDLGEEVKEIGEIINGVADLLEKPNHPRLIQATAEFAKVVEQIVVARRKNFEAGSDLLSSLMTARDEESGASMGDQQIRNEVMGLLLAGYETTANALTWTIYLLSQHPWVAERLYSQVHQALGGCMPSSSDLKNLPYLRQVLDESLRLFPPAWIIGRRALASDVMGGYHVPPGTVIAICIYTLHRHPDFWEQPELFDPERFTPEKTAERDRYAYIPFSIGPRQCIGSGFSLLEASLILACIAQRFELRLLEGIDVRPQALFVLRPNRDLLMTLHPVNNFKKWEE
jgi:cytochrome P450